MALVADGLVELYHQLLVVQQVRVEQVGLVEYEDHGHAVGLCGGEEAVDEGGGGLWLAYGDDEQGLIDVGGQDMTLLGEVDAFTDDVVAAVFDAGYPAAFAYGDTVAHGNRIGRADAAEPEVAFYLIIGSQSIVGEDGVPTAGVLDDESFHGPIPS